jgi:hypothetical protein
MTVSRGTTPLARYYGDGVQTNFPVPFVFFAGGNLRVILGPSNAAAETVLTLDVDYSVQQTASGGNVTLAVPPPAGAVLVIRLSLPLEQELDMHNQGRLDTEAIERALDKIILILMQQQDDLDRSLKQSVLVPGAPPTAEAFYAAFMQAANEAFAAAMQALAEMADSVEASAERAEAAARETYLESGVYNVRRCFVAGEDIEAGGTLTLPVGYYPTRAVLWLSWQDMPCTPKDADPDGTGKYLYSEVGANPNVLSTQVTVHFPVRAGDKFDLWVVTSAHGKNLDAQAAYTAECQAKAAASRISAETAALSEAAAGQSATAASESATGAAGSATTAGEKATAAAGSASAAAADAALVAGAVAVEQARAEAVEGILAMRVDGIEGKSARLNGHTFSFDVFSADAEIYAEQQQELDDYALAQLGLEDVSQLPNYIAVHNLFGDHLYIFNQASIGTGTVGNPEFPAAWVDNGLDTVSTAANGKLGVVQGSTESRKVSVNAANGTMTVNNVPEQAVEDDLHTAGIVNAATGGSVTVAGKDDDVQRADMGVEYSGASPLAYMAAYDEDGARTALWVKASGSIAVQRQGGEIEEVGVVGGATVTRWKTILAEALPANSTLTVPTYVPGTKSLFILLHGCLTDAGTSASNGFYGEITNNSIMLYVALPVGAELTAVVVA